MTNINWSLADARHHACMQRAHVTGQWEGNVKQALLLSSFCRWENDAQRLYIRSNVPKAVKWRSRVLNSDLTPKPCLYHWAFICKAYTIISLCYNLDKGCGYVCAQLRLTLCNPMDCSLSGSSVHRIFAGKNTRVGCHALLQVIFPMQGLNPCLLCLLRCRQILYPLRHQRSPRCHLYYNLDKACGYIKI